MNTFTLVDLSRLDFLELEEKLHESKLPANTLEKSATESQAGSGSLHGELATITAVVIVSLTALRVLAIWASQNRKTIKLRRETHELDSEGKPITKIEELTFHDSLTDDKALQKLAEALKLDISKLT